MQDVQISKQHIGQIVQNMWWPAAGHKDREERRIAGGVVVEIIALMLFIYVY